MPVVSQPHDYMADDVYLDLQRVIGLDVHLKCEGFNFSGSVKVKAAARMVEAAEQAGRLIPGSIIVESSSGNLGVALSAIAASKGYEFLCVTDPNCSPLSWRAMRAYGARVHKVTELDENDGYLGSRIRFIARLCASDSRYVWLNQYTNENNVRSHYDTTAAAIAKQFPELDVLFIGAGTTGTLMGCGQYFRSYPRRVLLIAIDSLGSVTFGGASGRRMVPGLGSSRRPEILDESLIDDVVHVSEADAIRTCHRLARRGFLFGGSTGTVVTGAQRWLAENRPGGGLQAVAIAPDFGERYLETVYDADWVERHFGPGVIAGSDD